MERESFEDENVAKQLATDFVCIKVDREEKPAVDAMYMTVCQLLTGSGGWPLSVFVDSKKRSFYAGTYFPKESFQSILKQIAALWKNDSQGLKDRAERITLALKSEGGKRKTEPLGFLKLENSPKTAFDSLSARLTWMARPFSRRISPAKFRAERAFSSARRSVTFFPTSG